MTEPKEPTPDKRLAEVDADLARATYAARLVRWELLAEQLAATTELRDMIVAQAPGLEISPYPIEQAVSFMYRDTAAAYVELADAHHALSGDVPHLPPPGDPPPTTAERAKIGPPAPPNELTRDGALVAGLLTKLRAAADGDGLVVSVTDRAALMAEFVAHFGLTIE